MKPVKKFSPSSWEKSRAGLVSGKYLCYLIVQSGTGFSRRMPMEGSILEPIVQELLERGNIVSGVLLRFIANI
jgi:hypothetical protein